MVNRQYLISRTSCNIFVLLGLLLAIVTGEYRILFPEKNNSHISQIQNLFWCIRKCLITKVLRLAIYRITLLKMTEIKQNVE